ncbi:histidine kinase [Dactylosporangium sp. AC04546]|uniref:sensor histidine kinase n=1 Tax=Dactylosporangium sp. AC04546 TaxID=2862460 RepID=UPI001EDD2063|nr:histidine kinase [Dactylosporangium sp. AC04546]WVK79605.1 histidine kinase [Dactylosporangium sp. AC04546]
MHGLLGWSGRNPWLAEAALAAVLLAAAAGLPDGRPWWVRLPLLLVLVSTVLWRRRHPRAAAAVAVGAAWAGLLGGVWEQHLPLAHVALLVVVYTLVVRGRRRSAALVAPFVAAFFVVWALRWYPGVDAGWGAAGFCLSVGTAWLLGEYVRARQEYVRAQRRAVAAAAIAGERARIARELHDVLAHSVGVMVVNAEGARLMRHTDPAVVDRTLGLVSSTGRAALQELRRLLDVLQPSGDGVLPPPGEGHGPPPGAPADLRDLVARAGAGLAGARLRIAGSADGVPAWLLGQVYRIVQEALTNVLNHAGARASVDVLLDFGAPGRRRTVRVEVVDTGGDGGGPGLPSSGRGLAGMRQRVTDAGGTLEAAPVPGGFRLAATLPVDGSTAASQPATAASQRRGGRMRRWPHGY